MFPTNVAVTFSLMRPAEFHYKRGLNTLEEVITQIERWEREPRRLLPGLEELSPFFAMENPRIRSKMNLANNELSELYKLDAQIPDIPQMWVEGTTNYALAAQVALIKGTIQSYLKDLEEEYKAMEAELKSLPELYPFPESQ